MEMPKKMIALVDGRHAAVDYLFLGVDRDQEESWSKVDRGDDVLFQAEISKGNQVFPSIRWSAITKKRGILLIGMMRAVCLGGNVS
jgi:hypothetical protein